MTDTPRDPNASPQTEALIDRVAQLERELAELKADLGAARGRVKLSMRAQLRCPDCGGRKLAHSPQVNDGDQGRYALGLAQPSIWRSKRVGEFEVYLCTECGLAEWYVKDARNLVDEHPQFFKRVETPKDDGTPYR